MTYKLARLLKDAGFPQEPRIDISGIDGEFFGGFYYIVKEGVNEVAPNFINQREYEQYLQSASDPITPANNPSELVKIPALEELIEAVRGLVLITGEGMETCRFELIGNQVEKSVGWQASAGDTYAKQVARNLTDAIGDSHEEAVANLWLDLRQCGH